MYGVGDLKNGVFIEFESYSEAEQEIDDLVSELLEVSKESIRLGTAYEKEGGTCNSDIAEYVYRAIAGEELDLLAEESIRDFHYIEEIVSDEEE